ELGEYLTIHDYPKSATIFRNGDPGDAMYLIDVGKVRISVTDADGHAVTLAELGPGDFFGEMSMLDGHGRSANATATENARLAQSGAEHDLRVASAHHHDVAESAGRERSVAGEPRLSSESQERTPSERYHSASGRDRETKARVGQFCSPRDKCRRGDRIGSTSSGGPIPTTLVGAR